MEKTEEVGTRRRDGAADGGRGAVAARQSAASGCRAKKPSGAVVRGTVAFWRSFKRKDSEKC